MKKRKVYLILFSLVCIFLMQGQVEADVIFKGDTNQTAGSIFGLYTNHKQITEGKSTRDAYCCQMYREMPEPGGKCKVVTWDERKDNIAVAAIIDNIDYGISFNSNTYLNASKEQRKNENGSPDYATRYGNIQMLINSYLAVEGYSYVCGLDGYCISATKSRYKNGKLIKETKKNLGFTGKSGSYYISLKYENKVRQKIDALIETKLTNYSVYRNINVEKPPQLSYNAKTGKYSVKISFVNKNDVDISWGKYEYKYDNNNWINDKYKVELNPTNLKNCKVKNKTKSAFEVECDKVDTTKTAKLSTTVNFSYSAWLVYRYSCDGVDDDNSVYNKQMMVDSKTYEYKYSKNITVSSSKSGVTPPPEDECPIKNKTPYQKAQLYETDKHNKENKLLDFNNTACDPVEYTPTVTKSCTASSVITPTTHFNENDLSGYVEKVKGTNATFYCATDFILNTSALAQLKDKTIDAGRIVLTNANSTNFSATIRRTCYAFNASKITAATAFSGFNPRTYISKIIVNGDDLIPQATLSAPVDGTVDYSKINLRKFVRSYTFSLNKLNYILKMSGEVTENTSCVATGECKGIGGLVINFNSTGFANFNPQIKLAEKYAEDYNISNKINSNDAVCKINIEQHKRIILDKMNLEYRMIDTSQPFPGKSGNGRKTGSNWCSNEANDRCAKTNLTVKNYILNKNNSYNKLNRSPLYTIELTPNTIKDIRNYNKDKTYNDYNVACNRNGVCNSVFFDRYGIVRHN